MEQVTLTSSSAAVYVDYGRKAEACESGNHVYTSEDWSLGEVMEEKKNYYCFSKTYAEKRALELSKEGGCINFVCCVRVLFGVLW